MAPRCSRVLFKKTVGVLAAFVTLAAASTAAASHRTAPECKHEVPNGAVVDLASGRVTLNGEVVAQYDDSACTSPARSKRSVSPALTPMQMSPMVGFPDSSVPAHGGSDNGGYYAGYYVDTTPYQVADKFVGDMYVPPPASNIQNPSGDWYWAMWPGLFSWNSWGDVVLQPILAYTGNGISHSYSYASVMDLDNGATQYGTPEQGTSPGHWIQGGIVQTSSNSWEVYTADLTVTPVVYWTFTVSGTSSWAPFSTAMLVAPEGWSGDSVENDWGQFPSCQDLPSSDYLLFDFVNFDTPNPNWNSYTPYSGSWNIFGFGGSPRFPPNAPSCNWNIVPEGPSAQTTFN